jgi:hypothetical protein
MEALVMLDTTYPLQGKTRSAASQGVARLLSPGPGFSLHSVESDMRPLVETYIHDQFRKIHGARVRDFMPLLLTMDCNENLSAAAGIRPAAEQPLFLERYLGQGVERAIGRLVSGSVARRDIAEIGNLVATQRGSSQLLFLILTAVMHRSNFEWLVFTATPQVQKTINRLGFRLHVLGDANPSVLDEASLKDWGSYYDSRPQVVAGNIPASVALMESRRIFSGLLSYYEDAISSLATAIRQKDSHHARQYFAA